MMIIMTMALHSIDRPLFRRSFLGALARSELRRRRARRRARCAGAGAVRRRLVLPAAPSSIRGAGLSSGPSPAANGAAAADGPALSAAAPEKDVVALSGLDAYSASWEVRSLRGAGLGSSPPSPVQSRRGTQLLTLTRPFPCAARMEG